MSERTVLDDFAGWARSLGDPDRRALIAVLMQQRRAGESDLLRDFASMAAAVLLDAERQAADAIAALDWTEDVGP